MSWWNFTKAVFHGEHKLAPMTWVAAVATVVYTISPLDFIPELFLGPLGLADDLGLWAVLIALAAKEKSRYEVSVHGGEYVKATRLS
ncbi:YkvA family protein [Demequina sp.]|uniref:YkvA family protein n=1 Tax=Demequina sp. TaxID=2050685 RepID=UPI003D150C0B